MIQMEAMDSSELKQFVRERLGCSCPDEVFSSIHVTDNPVAFNSLPVDYLVEIGNRLLIAVITLQSRDNINDTIERIIDIGRLYRDSNAFNRFRMVVVLAGEDDMNSVQQAFDSVTGKDEKIHLHLIEPSDLPGLLHVSTG